MGWRGGVSVALGWRFGVSVEWLLEERTHILEEIFFVLQHIWARWCKKICHKQISEIKSVSPSLLPEMWSHFNTFLSVPPPSSLHHSQLIFLSLRSYFLSWFRACKLCRWKFALRNRGYSFFSKTHTYCVHTRRCLVLGEMLIIVIYIYSTMHCATLAVRCL